MRSIKKEGIEMKNKIKIISAVLAFGLVSQPINLLAFTKTETIYTVLNADGTVQNTTVTNHLSVKNESEINDETELKNILNINGDETFSSTDEFLNWRVEGKDIFYTGETEKTFPIETDVKYYLNGEEKRSR